MTEKERFEAFKAAVMSDCEAKAAQIEADARAESESYKKNLHDEQTALYAKRSLETENKKDLTLARETAGRELLAKRAVLSYREELIDALFEKTQKRLKDIAKTDRHKEYVLKSLEQISKEYQGEKGIALLSPEHMELEGEITKRFGYEVQSDERLYLGGVNVRFPRLGIMIDKSVSSALEQERADFAKNNKELGV
ncbi:MAG: V-type ATP synthase subunit E [Ruminococcus sp.]|nr:V-type ATP synthase subunit E [Ruminococcus sp.]